MNHDAPHDTPAFGDQVQALLVYALFCLFLFSLRSLSTVLFGFSGLLLGGFVGYLAGPSSTGSFLPLLIGANMGAGLGVAAGYYFIKRKADNNSLIANLTCFLQPIDN